MTKCGYIIAWVGECTNEKPCPNHGSIKCTSCGKPATRECDYTGQFVCGAPLCNTCTYTNGDFSKGLGWGFIGHKHIRKEDASKI